MMYSILANIDSVWVLTAKQKNIMRKNAIETDVSNPLYCASCRHLFKVKDKIVTYCCLNYHFQCFNQNVTDSHELLKSENESLRNKVQELLAEKKVLIGLIHA